MDNQQLHGGAGTLNVLFHKNISDHNNSTRQINTIIDPVMRDESSTYTAGVTIRSDIITNRVEKLLINKDAPQTPELG